MTESELIFKVIQDAKLQSVDTSRQATDEYYDALQTAISRGFITTKDHRLTEKGYDVFTSGSIEKWEALKAKEKSDRHGSINVTGNAIFGNGNSGNVQGSTLRDLNNLSPTTKNNPHKNQPIAKPIKKSEHTIWDKIKYISVIVGGLTALFLAMGKMLEWW